MPLVREPSILWWRSGLFLLLTAALAWSAESTCEGPWGKLELRETILQPPAHYLWDDLMADRTLWEFPAMDREAALRKLADFRWNAENLSLARGGTWTAIPGGIALEPSPELILNLSRPQRTALYRYLAQNPTSAWQRVTCGIEGGDLRVLGHDLPPDLLNLADSLTYFRGQSRKLSDLPFLMSQTAAPEMRRAIVQTVSRTRALSAALIIDEDTDADAVARYWAAGSDHRRVAALISSVQNTDGGGKLDIANLLPPMPRRYLNAYVRLEDAVGADLPDCLWAAFNFFRGEAASRTLGTTLNLESHLEAGFDPVQPPYQLGDLFMVYEKPTGLFVHAYNHIADGVVFTKNGRNPLKPCVLMRYENMIASYREEVELRTVAYRRKQDQ